MNKTAFVTSPALIYTLPIAVGLVILSVWYGVIFLFDIPLFILPFPHQIIRTLVNEWPLLGHAAWSTAKAALLGFSCAVVIGLVLSLILASSRLLKAAVYPWILALQMIPVIVLIPIFVIWMSPGLPSITAITFMISFFPVVANTTMGLISTDEGLSKLFTFYGANRWQEMLWLKLPYALPYFLTGVKIAATLAPIGAITGDLLAGTSGSSGGLGFLVISYSSQLRTDGVFAVALLSSLLGFAFVSSVHFLHHKLLKRWHASAVSPVS